MSDSEPDEELEELRERKLAELRAEVEGGSGTVSSTPDEPVHVESADHYRELVAGHDVVLADFYADWCGPCKMLEPVVEELAAETDAAVLKVDVDAHQGLAAEMDVQGVPTLYVYSDGEAVDRVVGVQEKSQLRARIEGAA